MQKSSFNVGFFTCMCRFGPLRNQWCMRFEAKNAHIKSMVGKNFKNLPYTIATKHQHYMCLQMLSAPGVEPSNFLYKGDEVGRGTIYFVISALNALSG